MNFLRPVVLVAALAASVVLSQVVAPGVADAAGTAQQSELRPRPELLVSGQWLSDHLGDARLRIVDLRSRSEYEAGHIPNAVHLSMGNLSTTVRGIPGMLPPVSRVQAALRQAGIAEDGVVVAYDAARGLHSARLFWALEHLGHKGGRVLDGGWMGWLAEGRTQRRPQSRKRESPSPSIFVARPQPRTIADLEWVRSRLNDGKTA